jgi:F0F1-type ATP synthase assembly protein I
MLADFPVLYVDLIVRRTIVSCIALAVVALAIGFVVNQPLAGVGALLGLAAATLNHRVFQVSTVRYSKDDGHMDRRPYVGTVAARLGGITVVAFALLFLVRPMGFGMVGGLVAFQLLLMANALGALWRYQRLQLAGLGPAVTGRAEAGESQAPQAQAELPGTSGPGEGGANG